MYSYYILELSVIQDEYFKYEHHVYNSLRDIQNTLRRDLKDSKNLYALVWLKEKVSLITVENNREVARTELRPSLRISLPGQEPIWFDKSGQQKGLDFNALQENPKKGEKPLLIKLSEGEIKDYEVEIDWDQVDIPPLSGELLPVGEEAECLFAGSKMADELDYGPNTLVM